jgi:hypothetical protein
MRSSRSRLVLFAIVAPLAAILAIVPLVRARARAAGAAMPFHPGEKLVYQVGWMSMSQALTASLKVMPRLDFYGDPAWHFQAVAHSEDPLRYAYVLDDQFDSYAGARSLATRQYEMYLNEQGKQSARKLTLNAHHPGTERVSAPAGTRDPLAALYALRANNWQRTPRMFSPVFDGRHFYQMFAQIVAEHDSVVVPAGTFDASRISVSVTSHQSSEPMNFTIWLANNASRTPVEVDAVVPIGTVKGQLVRVE